jgi:hypothetical protein
MFLYHAELEVERLRLRAPELRSTTHGAKGVTAVANAEKKKLLSTHAASKKQQRELCRLALARAKSYSRQRYFERGERSLARIYSAEALAQQEFRKLAAKRKVRAQVATCDVTEGGKRRKLAPPPEAYWHLLNPLQAADAKVKRTKATGYGNDALTRKTTNENKRKALLKPPPGTVVPAPKKGTRRRSAKQLAALSRPNVVPPLRRRVGKRKAAVEAEQRVSSNLATELESAAEAEQSAAVEAQACEEMEAAAAARSAALRQETAQWLQQNSALATAAKAAAKRAAEEATAAAEVARQAHSERARAREIAEIERKVRTFRDAFKATHKRSPTAKDMQCAEHTRTRLLIERYNQLKHGAAPPSLRRHRKGMSQA